MEVFWLEDSYGPKAEIQSKLGAPTQKILGVTKGGNPLVII